MNRKETYKTKILTVYINWNPIYVVQTIKNNHISQLQVVTSDTNTERPGSLLFYNHHTSPPRRQQFSVRNKNKLHE